MNNSPQQPTPEDREYLQAELARMVGVGRIGLDTFQQLLDSVFAAEDTAVLARIHARYVGPPPGDWASAAPPTPPGTPPAQGQDPGHRNGPDTPAHPPTEMPRQPGYPPQQPGSPTPQQPPQSPGAPYPPQQHPGGQPPAPGHGFPPAASPQYQSQEFNSTMGTIKRAGQWLVPEHCSFKLNGATLDLDLREATAAGPVITFDIRATAASVKITVPPGVHVTNQMNESWSNSTFNVTAPAQGAPRVILTGHIRGSNVEVVTRAPGEKTFWEKLFE